MPNLKRWSLVCIYMVIFIDSLGASLIIPMLTPIAHDPIIGLISMGSESFRNIIYGVVLGAFSIAMFFGAPLLGALSDSLGRKKILLLCLSGLAGSYFLLAFSLVFKNLTIFIVGRVIGGFFSGCLPVAQASIIDVTDEKDRARFIGYIMFFVSLGYVTGPLIGGYFSDSAMVPWFNLMTPFIFIAILSVLNLFILLFVFKEQKNEGGYKSKLTLPNPISSLLLALKAESIRIYSLLLLLMLMGWNTFFQFIGLFLTDKLDFTPQGVSSFISWVGIGLSVAFLSLVGIMMRHFTPPRMVFIALIMMSACIGGALIITHNFTLYLLACGGAIGFGLSYSGLMAQLSMSVDASQQGAIMGMAATVAAFSAGFSGFVFGFIANISSSMPIIIALFFLCSSILVSIYDKKKVSLPE